MDFLDDYYNLVISNKLECQCVIQYSMNIIILNWDMGGQPSAPQDLHVGCCHLACIDYPRDTGED